MPSAIYQLFRKAILQEKQVTCVYQGKYRELFPVVIGRTEGEEKVLAFQVGGETSTGKVPSDGRWKCLFLAEVSDAHMREGSWREGTSHKTRQRCVDDVDLDINVHVRKLR